MRPSVRSEARRRMLARAPARPGKRANDTPGSARRTARSRAPTASVDRRDEAAARTRPDRRAARKRCPGFRPPPGNMDRVFALLAYPVAFEPTLRLADQR